MTITPPHHRPESRCR